MYEIIQFFLKKPKKTQKNPKKPKKPKKTQKNPLGWAFLKKPGFFPTLTRSKNKRVLFIYQTLWFSPPPLSVQTT